MWFINLLLSNLIGQIATTMVESLTMCAYLLVLLYVYPYYKFLITVLYNVLVQVHSAFMYVCIYGHVCLLIECTNSDKKGWDPTPITNWSYYTSIQFLYSPESALYIHVLFVFSSFLSSQRLLERDCLRDILNYFLILYSMLWWEFCCVCVCIMYTSMHCIQVILISCFTVLWKRSC